MSEPQDINIPLPVNPGVSGSVSVLDTTVKAAGFARHAVLAMYVDQSVTVFYKIKLAGGSTWRTVNGGGAGEVCAASTVFQRDFPLWGDNQQIVITNGTTPPVTWEVSCRLTSERALAQ